MGQNYAYALPSAAMALNHLPKRHVCAIDLSRQSGGDAQRPPHIARPAGGARPCDSAPLATSCGPVSEALQRAAHVRGRSADSDAV